MSIKTQLNAEILDELENLKKVELGSDQHKVSVDALTKLLDRSIEFDKLDMEYQDKYECREHEAELKREQMKDEKRDRLIKNILTGVGMVGGAGLTIWGTFKSFEFEKEGSITTIMGRGFINKLLPKK